jgi:hypothetical protein
MRYAIPHQELGLFARDLIVLGNIKKPVEAPGARLKCGDR